MGLIPMVSRSSVGVKRWFCHNNRLEQMHEIALHKIFMLSMVRIHHNHAPEPSRVSWQ
jgi:hypothetical protein